MIIDINKRFGLKNQDYYFDRPFYRVLVAFYTGRSVPVYHHFIITEYNGVRLYDGSINFLGLVSVINLGDLVGLLQSDALVYGVKQDLNLNGITVSDSVPCYFSSEEDAKVALDRSSSFGSKLNNIDRIESKKYEAVDLELCIKQLNYNEALEIQRAYSLQEQIQEIKLEEVKRYLLFAQVTSINPDKNGFLYHESGKSFSRLTRGNFISTQGLAHKRACGAEIEGLTGELGNQFIGVYYKLPSITYKSFEAYLRDASSALAEPALKAVSGFQFYLRKKSEYMRDEALRRLKNLWNSDAGGGRYRGGGYNF